MNSFKNILLLLVLAMVVSTMSASAVNVDSLTTTVSVLQTLATILVAPASPSMMPGTSQVIIATGTDVAGDPMTINPTWSVVRVDAGSLNLNTVIVSGGSTATLTVGQYEPPGGLTLTATDGIIGTATVTINSLKSINIQEESVNFGDVSAGGLSSPQTVHITNTGNVATLVQITPSTLLYGTYEIPGTSIIASTGLIMNLPTPGTEYLTHLTLNPVPTVHAGTYTGTIQFSTL